MRAALPPRPVLIAILVMVFVVAWNVSAWKASLQWIHAGRFIEMSGPGGHPVGVVSAVHDPFKFWAFTALFPVGGAIGLAVGVRELIFAIIDRRGLERLGRRSNLRQRNAELSSPIHRSFRITLGNRGGRNVE